MAKKQAFTDDDNALLEELGIETEVKKVVAHTPKAVSYTHLTLPTICSV